MGGGGYEYVKIYDGGVTGGGRGSNFGDFLRDVIKVWPLSIIHQKEVNNAHLNTTVNEVENVTPYGWWGGGRRRELMYCNISLLFLHI